MSRALGGEPGTSAKPPGTLRTCKADRNENNPTARAPTLFSPSPWVSYRHLEIKMAQNEMHPLHHKRALCHLRECPHHSPRCSSHKPESSLPLSFPHSLYIIHQLDLSVFLRSGHFSAPPFPTALIQAPCS